MARKHIRAPPCRNVVPTCQASWPVSWLGGQVSWPHRLWASPTSLDTCMKRFSKIRQTLAGRPYFGSVGLGVCAMSSPHVILSVTMFYFGHNEDMYGFWSR
jgi:hypothetical protein